MKKRTRVYDSIVDWLSDHRWHEISGLARLTPYPEQWLAALMREADFEIDPERGQIRLR